MILFGGLGGAIALVYLLAPLAAARFGLLGKIVGIVVGLIAGWAGGCMAGAFFTLPLVIFLENTARIISLLLKVLGVVFIFYMGFQGLVHRGWRAAAAIFCIGLHRPEERDRLSPVNKNPA